MKSVSFWGTRRIHSSERYVFNFGSCDLTCLVIIWFLLVKNRMCFVIELVDEVISQDDMNI